tara:strand:- start:163 stop:582 length:420 start_codon:yes stop_codon:yes gene_type:complete
MKRLSYALLRNELSAKLCVLTAFPVFVKIASTLNKHRKTITARAAILEVLIEPQRIAMPLKATSVRLDDETLTRVGEMAKAMDRPRAWLMAEAIKQYVAREEWFIREVEKGVKAADEGRLSDHADVKAKWEAKRAAQMD